MKKKVLIIEDDLSVRENISEILIEEGYEVLQAVNGKKGYQEAVRNIPDIIICDILMPEMNGYEVIHFLKKNPLTRDIPFLFLTAKTDLSDIRKGMGTGADDYITKPFSIKDLLNAIKIRLEKYESNKKKLKELTLSLEMSLPHELRTPLVGIIGFSRLIADNPELYSYEEIKEFAEGIYRSGKRLHRLIENFLYIARLEIISANPSELNKQKMERVSKAGTILNQAAVEKAKYAERVEDLEVSISDFEAKISLEGFMKVLDEIIDNAFKFSSPGDKVRIKTGEEDEFIVISVSNEGSQMTEEQITAIMPHMQFERKFHEQQGPGLGLSIAMKIVELYDGKIIITSGDNKITFDIKLFKP
ncbi:MAG: response regulator [Ignavibacteria bacterium]|nr:response regulator [Ignavibacteria bacterium]